MNKWFWILIILSLVITSCEKSSYEYSRESTIEVIYQNGDVDTLVFKHSRTVDETTFDLGNEYKKELIEYRIINDNSPCLVVMYLNTYGAYKNLTCGVRRFNILEDSVECEKVITEE